MKNPSVSHLRILKIPLLLLFLTACGSHVNTPAEPVVRDLGILAAPAEESAAPVVRELGILNTPDEAQADAGLIFSLPEYTGEPFAEVSEGPFFTESEMTDKPFLMFSPLDELGRCGPASACLGKDLAPEEKRGSIGAVKPSGWHTVKYDGIEGNYLYNRCHLIGYQLCGENANERNLITGTRYMNVQGMEPFESRTAAYIESTGCHVMYRATPVFSGSNLLAEGVLLEAQSVEEDDFSFCVFCFNVQPGVVIDYATGESDGKEFTGNE